MQIGRLFEMVYLLMDKKNMTANELAAHFEVSKRTILRDIDTLSAAGIPIYTSQGRGGGVSILDRYVLNKAVLSEEEQNQILFALQGLAATQNFSSKGTLDKLKGLFEKSDTNWIEVDFSRWGNSAPDRAKFEHLKTAVTQKRALTFRYSSSYGRTGERKVYPLKLVFKSTAWYLQAFCLPEAHYRTFKISRMRSLQIHDESFGEMTFHIPDMDVPDIQHPSLLEVRLLFAPQMAYRVYDEFDEADLTKNADGSFLVTKRLPNDDWLYGYILSFGSFIEVLSPQNVRDEVARQAHQIKMKYRRKT